MSCHDRLAEACLGVEHIIIVIETFGLSVFRMVRENGAKDECGIAVAAWQGSRTGVMGIREYIV
jgi:hypothetical protein